MDTADATRKLLHNFGALADLGQEIAETNNFQDMVRASLHLLLGALAIRRGLLAEYHEDEGLIKFAATRGISENHLTSLTLSVSDSEELKHHRICIIRPDDLSFAETSFTSRHQNVLVALGIELVVPLVVRGNLLGLIMLGGKASEQAFTAEDREVVCSMARHIGVGLHTHRLITEVERRAVENRQLYEGLRATYKDTVRAFAAAIDYKDKYTQGHSERVGKYSEIIARELNWSDDHIEGISIAGYLHDIGKLVIDREIINAPYKIDVKQSKELSRHPVIGYEILAPISHPYADIPLTARHHHERLDGSGYPDGLSGEEIPIGARIVTLADSFDAMTTDRPYKLRRPLKDVLEDLRANTGSQFDPIIVAAFCRAFLKEVRNETKDRRIIGLLGEDYVEPDQTASLLASVLAELRAKEFATSSEVSQAISAECEV
jgi:HD-GYP domain-containing protein (c-di-GMP phosphodiesterase class II)